MKIDMTKVEVPANNDNTPRVSPVIEPGVQDLTITKASDKIAGTGTAYVEIELTSKDPNKQYPLIERFFTSSKALPRLKVLYETLLGEDFTGEIDTEVLNPKLVGKTATWMVDGEEYPKESAGKVYTNVRPRLAFNNFLNPSADSKPYIKPLPVTPTTGTATGIPDGVDINTVTSLPDDLPF